jgi:hypothetical protein
MYGYTTLPRLEVLAYLRIIFDKYPIMPRHGRTKLVPLNTEPAKQALDALEASLAEQKEEPLLTELDDKIECPKMP